MEYMKKWNIRRAHSFYNKLNIRGGDIFVHMWRSTLETRFSRRTACRCTHIYTQGHRHLRCHIIKTRDYFLITISNYQAINYLLQLTICNCIEAMVIYRRYSVPIIRL